MLTKEKVIAFLHSLQWKRMSKKELEGLLQAFFNTDNLLEDSTEVECNDTDFSFIFTNGNPESTTNFIDVEIYYLKMRKRNHIIITGTDLLDFQIPKLVNTLSLEKAITTYKESVNNVSNTENNVLANTVKIFSELGITENKGLMFGNTVYGLCKKENGVFVPAYFENNANEMKPIYDREKTFDFGWADFSDCCSIINALTKWIGSNDVNFIKTKIIDL